MSKMFWICLGLFLLLAGGAAWYIIVAGNDTPVTARERQTGFNVHDELKDLNKETAVETAPPVAVGAAEEKKDEFPVSEQEIADYYNKHKSGFVEDADPAGSMRAAHILVYKHEIAAEILAQLRKAPDSFAKLAEKHSACDSSSSGGDLGVFNRGAMVKEFEQAVLALKPGEISGVVKTQFGYHIIRRDPIRTGKQLTLQEVSERIRNIIREEKKDAKMRERIGNVLNSGSAALEK